MENKLTDRILKYACIASALASLTLGAVKLFDKKDLYVNYSDVNEDGIEDIVSYSIKNGPNCVFIGKGDGLYERAKMKVCDGIPFFYTPNGWYDPWGSYFGFDGTIKGSDGLIMRFKEK